jgi:hypothetical protein
MNKLILVFTTMALFACNNNSTDQSTETEKKDSAPATTTVMLTDEEKKEGWKLLFDGSSTKGWHKYGAAVAGTAWKVADGNLYLDASEKEKLPDGKPGWQIKDGGDIVTDEEYENFHLKLEWKIDTCGNSGIIFYIHEDPAKYKWAWETGPEMQILDNSCHADAKISKHRAGDLYDLISCSKETVKPALEWNGVEIKCINGKLDFWLNGENVVSTTLWDENWKAMLKNTKWAEHPGFSTFKKGKIGLQDHGNNVWFRNIRIKKL